MSCQKHASEPFKTSSVKIFPSKYFSCQFGGVLIRMQRGCTHLYGSLLRSQPNSIGILPRHAILQGREEKLSIFLSQGYCSSSVRNGIALAWKMHSPQITEQHHSDRGSMTVADSKYRWGGGNGRNVLELSG